MPVLQVPGAESVLGCIGKLSRTVPLLENLARSSGAPSLQPRRCAAALKSVPACLPLSILAADNCLQGSCF
jgi:hypothetical protein